MHPGTRKRSTNRGATRPVVQDYSRSSEVIDFLVRSMHGFGVSSGVGQEEVRVELLCYNDGSRSDAKRYYPLKPLCSPGSL